MVDVGKIVDRMSESNVKYSDYKGDVKKLIDNFPFFVNCTVPVQAYSNGVDFVLKDGYTILAEDISRISSEGIKFSISSEHGKCYILVHY